MYTDGALDPKTGKSVYVPDLEIIKYKQLAQGVSFFTTEWA